MSLIPELYDLVRMFEGFGGKAYRCPAGIWTIGYGHTGGVTPNERVTKAAAMELLRDDLDRVAKRVKRAVRVPLDDHQLAALVSFTFNVGIGAFENSTLLRELNRGNYDAVPGQMARWVNITKNGKKIPLAGLIRRRAAEASLWLRSHGDDGGMPQAVSE